MATGITWYDVLGVSAGASSDTLFNAYTERIRQVAPEAFSGAPSPVVSAANRARDLIEAAWLVLGDRERRQRYDTALGLYRPGLTRHGGLGTGSAQDRQDPYDLLGVADGPMDGGLPLAVMAAVSAMAARPGPARRRRVLVPDVSGLFYRPCLAVLSAARLKPTLERLTPDPQPVEGLVVGQSPSAGSEVQPASVVTVRVWHPPRRR